MSHSDGEILTEQREHVLLIGVNRPAKLNAYTPKMLHELAQAYTLLEDDIGMRCAVLYGCGEHFTAGLDLPSMGPLMQGGTWAVPTALIDPLDLRPADDGRRRSKPVIVAVRGITCTIGVELMLAADIVVAASDSRFSQLEIKRGLIPPGGATVRWAQRAGLGNALLHLLTGDEFDAQEAFRLGMVQRVTAPGAERDTAIQIASRVAALAPLAVCALRANAILGVESGASAAAGQWRQIQQRLANSEDAAEGAAALAEKRNPRFTGR